MDKYAIYKGFWSNQSVTENFLRDMTNDNEILQYERTYSQLGGPDIQIPYVPYDINEVFNKWADEIHKNDSLFVP